ncbi:MAG: type II toxin-antitoxin system mRNA interferase toxin, RelE/StbE family [Pseudomonadaceae bacterium]|nr:type II toxin-antitoxin system mRNA interferase toxin, RelE/StbE family [Pseudomonadaceae bacterium]
MLKILTTEQFDLDVKTQKALGRDTKKLKPIIEDLVHKRALPVACCDNPIPHTWGRWSCRIAFDWWLLYKCDAKAGTIVLERTGSVKELFE